MFDLVYSIIPNHNEIMTDSICVSDSREPVTRRTHDHPWAADLETEKHADNTDFMIEEAIDAVKQTRSGQYVDLVTHESQGHPARYLYSVLESLDEELEITDSGRCTCGGYVSRISIQE